MARAVKPWRDARTGMYYIRRIVPEELRGTLGKLYKKSLGTKDPIEARTLFASAWLECERQYRIARARTESTPMMDLSDADQLASRWFSKELMKIQQDPERLKEYVLHVARADGPELESYGAHFEESLPLGFKAPIADVILSDEKLPQADAEFRKVLLRVLDRYILELSDICAQRSQGVWAEPSKVRPLEPLSFEKKDLGKTISQVFKAFSEDRIRTDGSGRTVEKTLREYGKVIRRFTELMGDLPVKQIDRQVIHDFQSLLFKIPSKGTGIRSMSCREQLAKAEAEGLPTLSTVSVSQQMAIISAVLNMGISMGLLQENPVVASGIARRLKKAISKGDRRRKDYILPELQKIFSSPIFRDGMEWSSQRLDLGKALYWIPLLAIYTGARREELCQLYAGDVKTIDGVACLSILETEDQEDTSGRTVKTSSSRRLVPIHGDLLELGFMEYLEEVPRGGQLFPTLKQGNDGWYGSAFGQHWARYLREVVKLDSPAKPSHGFRHAFKTLSRSVGIPEDVHDALTGHSDGSVSRGYGQMPLSRLAEEMTKYPSIARAAGIL